MINKVEDLKNALFVDKTTTPLIVPIAGMSGKSLDINIEQSKKQGMKIEIIKTFKEEFYCSCCGDSRIMNVRNLYMNLDNRKVKSLIEEKVHSRQNYQEFFDFIVTQLIQELSPSFWKISCLQCQSNYFLIIYNDSTGQKMVILSDRNNGVSTKNTPNEVVYYLDQAYKAKVIGANSASVTMYRSALEHLLHNQGYTNGMLGEKIKKLEADIKSGVAKKWAVNMDTKVLKIIKDLGNGAIHTNGGDITKQQVLDGELISKLDIVFKYLLHEVYEAEIKQVALLNELSLVSGNLK